MNALPFPFFSDIQGKYEFYELENINYVDWNFQFLQVKLTLVKLINQGED
jgi:hypothetical protein